ncbi:MAG: winged helix-turn-helix transcriptional regulator [Candidatus Lokiarchaeota archaeon]|nr:winged helix-turn-helix transcriptional regulator [Candidatus Lokiarchaeota archaeon]
MKILIKQALDVLKALADESRLKILEILYDGEKSSKDIEDGLGKCQSTTSQHLKMLVEKQLVTSRQDGLKKYYTIKVEVVDFIAALDLLVRQINKHQSDIMAEHEIRDTLL